MIRMTLIAACLVSFFAQSAPQVPSTLPHFDYENARSHEIQPHRRSIPVAGITPGFNQLSITLKLSASGEVVEADGGGGGNAEKFWSVVKPEVMRWKFTPFEKDGEAVPADVEEYVDLVPPERVPKVHIAAPKLQPDSDIAIELERTGCFGSCASYTVTLTTKGIVFDGGGDVSPVGGIPILSILRRCENWQGDSSRQIFTRWSPTID